MKTTTFTTFALAALLTACGGGGTTTTANEEKVETATSTRTCESIRDDVIRIAGTNGVTIVKIYDPKPLSTKPKSITCSGRALVSSGQEAKLYYRNFQDDDGDWLVQYSETPLQ